MAFVGEYDGRRLTGGRLLWLAALSCLLWTLISLGLYALL
jgi:hypothetical protein